MFIRDSVFEASRGLGPDADLQVVRYFEKSEMDKQAVTALWTRIYQMGL